ncbi:hypothetical protein [Streptomyces sp. ICBB 8177]|uniref:hypothetical protein n=1 Tax=Streptomyces sp. ICBB 8177 TaxID=563922 RepID=UPI000D67E5FA|nr:hypothetical protein [Streptomyces sp. ICBB 8177]PWI41120.1 hypothetical protein CK485_27615 [Streptomyces sp. ICBB 8177]
MNGQGEGGYAVGAVVVDTVRERVGVVVGEDGPGLVCLRAPGGGARWKARSADVCAAGPMDESRARVAEVNAFRTWRR